MSNARKAAGLANQMMPTVRDKRRVGGEMRWLAAVLDEPVASYDIACERDKVFTISFPLLAD